jgi:hypothetical protein
MSQTTMRYRRLPALPLALLVLAACGGASGDRDTAQRGAATGGTPAVAAADGAQKGCLPVAEVSSIVGFEVQDQTNGPRRYGNMVTCGYKRANSASGATVSTKTAPAADAEEHFAEMLDIVRSARGQAAQLESVGLGERSGAYTMSAKSEVAAVASGRFYQATVYAGEETNLGNKREATVELVRRLMRQ